MIRRKRMFLYSCTITSALLLFSSCGVTENYRVIESFNSELIYTETNSYTQGACSDGTYWYLMSPTDGISYLRRVNIQTGESEIASDGHGYSHGNGLCYNQNTGKLYITDMDGLGTISVVNPTTLAYESSINVYDEVGNDVSAISYNTENNEYIVVIHDCYDNSDPPSGFTVGTTYTAKFYAVLNYDFHFLRKYDLPNNYMISQGIESDRELIYFTYSNVDRRISGDYDDFIYVYNWYGQQIYVLNLGLSGLAEIESLSKIDENHFCGYFNNDGKVADIVLYTVARESIIKIDR